MPFFTNETQSTKKIPLFPSPRCGSCGLYKTVETPYMPLDGKGSKKILIVGEGPGEREDTLGQPFVGRTGQFLEDALYECGIDMREDCWITNSVRCRPWEWNKDKTKKKNRPPTDKEIAYCRPYLTGNGNLYGDIAKLKPEIIILLGSPAVRSVIGWLWREDPGGITRWAGWKIPCQKLNCWICPTFHPSYVVREDETDERPNRAVEQVWRKHLKEATSLRGRPWKKVPDFASQVTVEMAPRQAAQYIHTIIDMGKPTAIDLETDRLKPDPSDSEVVCCSMSNGIITIAYPWQGEAIKATQEFIKSPIPKVGANCKFEERWTRKVFGHGVKNWWFDTMLAAHVLDNRPEITGLKFQSFVLLGQQSYDDEIKPHFQSKGPNISSNLVKFCKNNLRKVLLYCGLDSLLEYEVAMIQAKQLGIEVPS